MHSLWDMMAGMVIGELGDESGDGWEGGACVSVYEGDVWESAMN